MLSVFSPWSRRLATIGVLTWWGVLVWQHRVAMHAAAAEAGTTRAVSNLVCLSEHIGGSAAACAQEKTEATARVQK
ncbi:MULTISPECIES: hypothetical protein [unclassified Paraburkholderia]|uniref:hypothetical protein n=1 Tax=unclassified Paraburkholderia TaxID=2615204 RepID=UPI002AB2AD0B|nr:MULTISPECIES: hypothetical protein [unclassified Paraburkholderia]